MSELTSKQAQLISIWLELKKLSELSDKRPKLFYKKFENTQNDYFFLWFDINRELIENKRIENRIERWDSEADAIQSLSSFQFQEYAQEKCFENL